MTLKSIREDVDSFGWRRWVFYAIGWWVWLMLNFAWLITNAIKKD